jgi:hypothetical protein
MNIQPNPMNETSEISFNLNKKDNVKVEVLDLVGRHIATVANNELSAGSHSYVIRKDKIGASGFYFIKLTVGNTSCIKKIIVN